ncbi:MAG TPA: thiamine-phosphate kinase, partial [Burkholderiales bacterium]|nr:thiamine-phosphate kinase [Burkholderiales bacterium]
VLAGGDDYELVFTAPASLRSRIVAAGKKARVPVTAIGTMVAGKPVVRVRDARGKPVTTSRTGFDHFA